MRSQETLLYSWSLAAQPRHGVVHDARCDALCKVWYKVLGVP